MRPVRSGGERAAIKWRKGWRRLIRPYPVRPVLLFVGWVWLALISLGLFAVMLISLRFGWQRTDLLAFWAVAIALATFLLAVLASAFAVTAYAISSRSPKLTPQIVVPGCQPNAVAFRRGKPDGADGVPLLTIDGDSLIAARFSLFNDSNWTANNVQSRLELNDLVLPAAFGSKFWIAAILDDTNEAVIGIQYRTVEQVHGRVRLWLDNINLAGLRLTGDAPAIMLFFHAEGYRSAHRLEVTIKD